MAPLLLSDSALPERPLPLGMAMPLTLPHNPTPLPLSPPPLHPLPPQARYWGAGANEVQGAVLSRSGAVVERLAGKWHEGLFRGPAPGQCVWRASKERGGRGGDAQSAVGVLST